jgi:sterol 24-C-methyltransferase
LPAGLNNNAYQISRALYHNGRTGRNLDQISRFVKADFMKQPFEDNTFDAVYQIDATCHAPDQVGCYKVSLRVTTELYATSSCSQCHNSVAFQLATR